MATMDAVKAVQERFGDLKIVAKPLCVYLDGRESGQVYISVPPDRLTEVMTFLRDDERCKFEMLCDVTCVDYLHFPKPPSDERYGVTYNLTSHTHNHRLFVKCFVSDPDPTVPSVCPIWSGANWTEREVYDLFGITFEGHPDLRRILLPDQFVDHPLRKDYPLTGKGERESLPIIGKHSA